MTRFKNSYNKTDFNRKIPFKVMLDELKINNKTEINVEVKDSKNFSKIQFILE